jgi:hypothetical protein
VGAIKAEGEMFGLLPLYSMIIQDRPPLNVCITIFDGRREIKIALCGFEKTRGQFSGGHSSQRNKRLE